MIVRMLTLIALATFAILPTLSLAAEGPKTETSKSPDEKSPSEKSASIKSQREASHSNATAAAKARLPRFYGRVVDDTKCEKLLKVAQEHAVVIAQKRAELKALTDKRDAALKLQLTPAQRQEVTKLQEDAKQRSEQARQQRAKSAKNSEAESSNSKAPAKKASS